MIKILLGTLWVDLYGGRSQSSGFKKFSWLNNSSSAIEVYIGIICACLPYGKPFLGRFSPGLFSSVNGTLMSNSGGRGTTRSLPPVSNRSQVRQGGVKSLTKAQNRQSTLGIRGESQEDIAYNVFVQEIEMDAVGSNSIISARSNTSKQEEGQIA